MALKSILFFYVRTGPIVSLKCQTLILFITGQ